MGTLLAVLLLFGFYALANFVPKEQRIASPIFPDEGLRLGLDLRGGIHWVLGVDLDVRVKHELETLGDRLERALDDDGLSSDSQSVEGQGSLRPTLTTRRGGPFGFNSPSTKTQRPCSRRKLANS